MGEGWQRGEGVRGWGCGGGGWCGGVWVWVVVVGVLQKSQKNRGKAKNFRGGVSKKKSIIIMVELRQNNILPKIYLYLIFKNIFVYLLLWKKLH